MSSDRSVTYVSGRTGGPRRQVPPGAGPSLHRDSFRRQGLDEGAPIRQLLLAGVALAEPLGDLPALRVIDRQRRADAVARRLAQGRTRVVEGQSVSVRV